MKLLHFGSVTEHTCILYKVVRIYPGYSPAIVRSPVRQSGYIASPQSHKSNQVRASF
jgi:hypothetical protein